MGTLYDQPPRNSRRVDLDDVDAYLEKAIALAKKHKIVLTDVIAAAHVLELARANSLRVDDGDISDERAAGIGGELQNIASAIEGVGQSA
jgi:hypothetical protein